MAVASWSAYFFSSSPRLLMLGTSSSAARSTGATGRGRMNRKAKTIKMTSGKVLCREIKESALCSCLMVVPPWDASALLAVELLDEGGNVLAIGADDVLAVVVILNAQHFPGVL